MPDSDYTRRDPRTYNLTGQKINKLSVLCFAGYKDYRAQWWCECECGNTSIQDAWRLRTQNAQSCGCSKGKHGAITHGQAHTPEYDAYHSAKSRCQKRSHKAFPSYGGRGIEFRFESFEDFYAELGDRPTTQHSLNRINNDGHYEVGNVEWALPAKQMQNIRTNVNITACGQTKTRSQWSRDTGLGIATIRDRIKTGWCNNCAVTIPRHKGKCPHRL